jgi:polysaccharide pyruvyl transferase WcaK-like protein
VRHILIPELVPLANKGEEAIVRGIADVLFPAGDCELHLFDEVEEYRFRDGIHVYPVKWFISPWLQREFGLGLTWEKMSASTCSLVRNGLHRVWPAWVSYPCRPLVRTSVGLTNLHGAGCESFGPVEAALSRLRNVDYLVAGHDGALNERVCQVIEVFRGLGKRFGVFGVELPSRFKSNEIVSIMGETLRNSEFFYARTSASAEVARRSFPGVRAEVLPDPAFGMKMATESEVDSVVRANDLERLFERPVVMCTTCEPPPIARHCFEGISGPRRKLEAHRQLLADLVSHVVQRYDANVLFLPHATGPGHALDDRVVASDVLRRSGIPESRGLVLQAALSARQLKGLIARAEFLIAERVHSMIGAVGAGTPFLCLGSNTDRRLAGIVRDMIGVGDSIYYLNKPSYASLAKHFDHSWEKRKQTGAHLEAKNEDFLFKLRSSATSIRDCIDAPDQRCGGG